MPECPVCKRPQWDGGHAMNEVECDSMNGEVCRLHAKLRVQMLPPELLEHLRMLLLSDVYKRAMLPDEHLRVSDWLSRLDAAVRDARRAALTPCEGA